MSHFKRLVPLAVTGDASVPFVAAEQCDRAQLERSDTLREAIAAAMSLLSEGPPGETAVMYVCRGAPLCGVRDQPPGFNATCPMCECLSVSEDGVIRYPQAGSA